MSKAAHRMSGLPVESREKAIKEHHLLPFLALDTIFSILILSWRDLRHNRKTVPMLWREEAKSATHI